MRERTARWSPECTLMISSSVTGREGREGLYGGVVRGGVRKGMGKGRRGKRRIEIYTF